MTPDIRHTVLAAIAQDKSNVAARLADLHHVTRQSASAWLTKLKREGVITASGAGRGICYQLVPLVHLRRIYARSNLHEDRVWREVIAPSVQDLPANVRDIWHYATTEIVNNAIDHSQAKEVMVVLLRDALNTTVYVVDNGEGIFSKIQRALNLFDPRDAILEIAKGKLTTDPVHHTGDGIFFVSKVMDDFNIYCDKLNFMHCDMGVDMLLEGIKGGPGTKILMRLVNNSTRNLQSVFDQFAVAGEPAFAKTIVPVRLAQHEGEQLVSRSQGKRLTMRFDQFKVVILDFDGVKEIGQAFADQVFRVFQQLHPTTKLVPIHMTECVENVYRRVIKQS
ncbi:ArsR family transcriptional regulator [Nitrosomonas nitrosa]|jgi:anti-sigma regulatory factor (Ser/Thr protein kinase)|uniref:STAS-like domain-containing protein n=1 Tax=Nitrosomonas nitrosa TaxID=52442 RepID=UPI000D31FFB7|nr:DUF4325 domain-containing protein [Nitrosomonas nitrosa]MCO6432756.1 DUF4325 domain-containing protein [Nitrosomonas nitrosa]PTR04933.1 ArsR family transcriptional regulator [Nitrosomonas nitrosa]